MDEKRLEKDPLEDFLNDLIEDAVRLGVRETVRDAVVHMAEDYVEEEFAITIIHDLLDDHMDEIGEELVGALLQLPVTILQGRKFQPEGKIL